MEPSKKTESEQSIRAFQKEVVRVIGRFNSKKKEAFATFFKNRSEEEVRKILPKSVFRMLCDLNTLEFRFFELMYYVTDTDRLVFLSRPGHSGMCRGRLNQFEYHSKERCCEMVVLSEDFLVQKGRFMKRAVERYRQLNALTTAHKVPAPKKKALPSDRSNKSRTGVPASFLYAGLYTDILENGENQSINEVAYSGYNRVAIERSQINFDFSLSGDLEDVEAVVELNCPIEFAVVNEDTGQLAKYIGIGTEPLNSDSQGVVVLLLKLTTPVSLDSGMVVAIFPKEHKQDSQSPTGVTKVPD